jgi:hypothetical protein
MRVRRGDIPNESEEGVNDGEATDETEHDDENTEDSLKWGFDEHHRTKIRTIKHSYVQDSSDELGHINDGDALAAECERNLSVHSTIRDNSLYAGDSTGQDALNVLEREVDIINVHLISGLASDKGV